MSSLYLTRPFSIKSGISTANQGPSWRRRGEERGVEGERHSTCLPLPTLLDTFHHSLFSLTPSLLPISLPLSFPSPPSHPPPPPPSPSLLALSSLPSIPPLLTPNAIACAMPNLGTFRAHNGLKWSVRQILPPLER